MLFKARRFVLLFLELELVLHLVEGGEGGTEFVYQAGVLPGDLGTEDLYFPAFTMFFRYWVLSSFYGRVLIL